MVRKVINVLKTHYKNNCGMGIGDFLRGSFVLLHLCKNKNVEFDIDFSQHPISKFLIKQNSNENNTNYEDVEYIHCDKDNDQLWNYILSKNTDVVYLYTNNYVTQDITDEERKIIGDKFVPTEQLQKEIDNTLIELHLEKKEYTVLHLRLGDKYLVNNECMSDNNINKLCNIINILVPPCAHLLLLSDNNYVKEKLRHIYPHFVIHNKEIVHTTYSTVNNALLNTLVDFFLVANSNTVTTLSPYWHISGFSQYCCIMNNIPFNGHRIEEL